MIVEKELEEKIVATLAAAFGDKYHVVGAWGVSPDGTVKGEETPADKVAIAVAVGAPQWDKYLVPSCTMPVALSVAIRREVAPTAAELETVMSPISDFLMDLQLDVSAAEALSSEHFTSDGAQVNGGPPPVFSEKTNIWRVTRTFNVRGVPCL